MVNETTILNFPAFPSRYAEAQAKQAELLAQARLAELLAQDQRLAEARRKSFIQGDYWMREVIDVLRERGEPMRIMELVNEVANNNKFPSWRAKVERRREVLKLISVMLRQGRLERWGRKKVTIPETDAKFQAWLASVSKPPDRRE